MPCLGPRIMDNSDSNLITQVHHKLQSHLHINKVMALGWHPLCQCLNPWTRPIDDKLFGGNNGVDNSP